MFWSPTEISEVRKNPFVLAHIYPAVHINKRTLTSMLVHNVYYVQFASTHGGVIPGIKCQYIPFCFALVGTPVKWPLRWLLSFFGGTLRLN